MKSKAGCVVGACVASIFVASCVCCGFMLEILPWQVPPPLAKYSLTTDGVMLTVEEWEMGVKKVSVNPKDPAVPMLTRSSSSDGIAVLTVSDGKRSTSTKATNFGNQVWSNRNRTWYFTQESHQSDGYKYWIISWDNAHGFRKMVEETELTTGLSLSLDEKSLVVNKTDSHTGDPFKLHIISLADNSLQRVTIPKWAENPLMISSDRFLVRQHSGRTDDAQVIFWSPGQIDEKDRRNDLKIGSERVLDMCAVNGEIFGILDHRGSVSLVRIDPTLTKVVKDLGWDFL